MQNRTRLVFLLPALFLVVTVAVFVWTDAARRRVEDDIRSLVGAHVASVARLVRAGAHEGSASVDLIYAMAEDNLWSMARLLEPRLHSQAPLTLPANFHGLAGLLRIDDDGNAFGVWNTEVDDRGEEIVSTVLAAPEGVVVDGGVLRQYGIYCAHNNVSGVVAILCRDAEELAELRRTTGLGPLLKSVVHKDVLYATIQDETGILASSSAIPMSAWEDDLQLAATRASSEVTFRSRPTDDGGGTAVLEGLAPMPLPDDTVAVLRVGVDGTRFFRVAADIEGRSLLLAWVLSALVLLSFAAAWIWQHHMTRKKAYEAEIARRMQVNRRWRAVGEMAAAVAHEVRNPLSTVSMAAQRLGCEFQVQEAEREEFQTLLSLISSESQRLGKVVTDFLELGKPVALAYVDWDVAELLEQASAPLLLRAENENKTVATSWDSLGSCPLDSDRIKQILANLVGNALDATSAEGVVELTARREADRLMLAVTDHGCGMDAETCQSVRKPFVSFKSNGTGLGLPIAEHLVEAHGGRLDLQSQPGKGTTVTVSLPTEPLPQPANGVDYVF